MNSASDGVTKDSRQIFPVQTGIVAATIILISLFAGVFVIGVSKPLGFVMVGAAIGASSHLVAARQRATIRGLLRYTLYGILFMAFLDFLNGFSL